MNTNTNRKNPDLLYPSIQPQINLIQPHINMSLTIGFLPHTFCPKKPPASGWSHRHYILSSSVSCPVKVTSISVLLYWHAPGYIVQDYNKFPYLCCLGHSTMEAGNLEKKSCGRRAHRALRVHSLVACRDWVGRPRPPRGSRSRSSPSLRVLLSSARLAGSARAGRKRGTWLCNESIFGVLLKLLNSNI
jgi:hypothetical protein